MSFFHTHKWVLVGKTYVPPSNRPISFGEGANVGQFDIVQELISGVTTFLWKCEGEDCDAFRQQKCLGKEVEK